jgi:hypothetical protein
MTGVWGIHMVFEMTNMPLDIEVFNNVSSRLLLLDFRIFLLFKENFSRDFSLFLVFKTKNLLLIQALTVFTLFS